MAPSLAGTGGEVGIILLRVPFGKRGGPARNMHTGIPLWHTICVNHM
jgi:hypothetical protein